MIVPKRHRLSLGESVEHSMELEGLVAKASDLLQREFGPPTLFEHGATTSGTRFGCGIDHAHLHLVPLNFGLEDATTRVSALSWINTDAPWRVASTGAYVTLCEPGMGWRRAEPSDVPHQFFRRAIASVLGAAEFDYDKYPAPEVADETVLRIQRQVELGFQAA